MYKIIGADRREYGPCSADELRQWFREGRVNAQTLIQAEGSAEWKPLAAHPELASFLSGAPLPGAHPPTIGPTVPVPTGDILQRDYDVDILSCVSRAWGLVQRHFWPVVGISLLVMVANSAANQFLGLFLYPAFGSQITQSYNYNSFGQSGSVHFTAGNGIAIGLAVVLGAPIQALLLGGLFRYYLKLMRGESADVGDAFSGFSVALVPLLLLGLVNSLLTSLGICLCVLPGIYLAVAWAFSLPLVIDRRMDFWAAMELSRKVVSRHWFLILGLILVNALVAFVGVFVCCVGLLVSIPVAYISTLYAYEDIFNRRPAGQA